ncbi:type II toxin-antitoxin system RelE/ParE family toxin [Nonomuraea sp. 3-1Str]|uniref:type II toxin-antitoxin system RelE/ParE family toxin n=1 Tax=Nonomuraea sp. 3-1Str TaxID=2929801 RepID=UPI0028634E16|nr:type II toxin-antitoxin system RelE/ParE family toxin [Nonomuraea sp. 3-1Str]MDR8412311.1 type II toxin-antitoxin system RelE/ParE family toxin [Nonomuraea sp. 3-1Str]
MSWEISLHPAVEEWYLAVCVDDPGTADLIHAAIDQLAEEGPTARRPLVDRVKGSRYHNMKELRPPSTGTTEIRMIFAFDPVREAIFLVAGDKAGNWSDWYDKAIALADERYTEHLIALGRQEER